MKASKKVSNSEKNYKYVNIEREERADEEMDDDCPECEEGEQSGTAFIDKDDEKGLYLLYGIIDQEAVGNIIYALTYMTKNDEITLEKQKELGQEVGLPPITLMMNSEGGVASELFALYDIIKKVQRTREFHTVGIGRVMSACVPLLACGTKGKRKIGKNTRVMLHAVGGGNSGSIHSIEVQFNEMKLAQKKYASLLEAETNMPKKLIDKILKKKVDVYLDADEAIKYGIADELL